MQNKKLKRKEDMAAIVDAWNAKHPAGTVVIVTNDMGQKREAATRSEAWLLENDMPVIMLDDVGGCFELARVQAKPML